MSRRLLECDAVSGEIRLSMADLQSKNRNQIVDDRFELAGEEADLANPDAV
jgi:hypothetical protein